MLSDDVLVQFRDDLARGKFIERQGLIFGRSG
jgi:hypothetical protein